MGCTPGKQIDTAKDNNNSDDEESRPTNSDPVNTDSAVTKDSNGVVNNKLKNKNSSDTDQVSERKRNKTPTIAKGEKKFTQSQLDFFEMLDKKIEAGADYVSEDGCSRTPSRGPSRVPSRTPSRTPSRNFKEER